MYIVGCIDIFLAFICLWCHCLYVSVYISLYGRQYIRGNVCLLRINVSVPYNDSMCIFISRAVMSLWRVYLSVCGVFMCRLYVCLHIRVYTWVSVKYVCIPICVCGLWCLYKLCLLCLYSS